MPKARNERVEIPDGKSIVFDNGTVAEDTGSSDTTSDGNSDGSNGNDTGGDIGATGNGDGTIHGDSGTGSDPFRPVREYDDGDDRIIRDENGNPTFSPTGRIRKRRTRGATGSGATPKQKTGKKVPVDALSRLLLMSHLMLANVSRTPELEINEDESMLIANPLSELLVLYEVEIDPRILQLMELGGACSYVYGPRIYMIRERLKAEAAAKRAAREAANARQVIPVGSGGPNFQSNANPEQGPLDIILN